MSKAGRVNSRGFRIVPQAKEALTAPERAQLFELVRLCGLMATAAELGISHVTLYKALDGHELRRSMTRAIRYQVRELAGGAK